MNGSESARASRWLAWATTVLVVGLFIASTAWRVSLGGDALLTLFEGAIAAPVAATVGAVIVSRRARNVIGWLLLLISFGWMVQDAGAAYTLGLLEVAEPSGGQLWVAWVGSYGWVLSFPAAIILLPLLYPDGRAPSRRWRPLVWLAVGDALLTPVQALAPGPLEVEGSMVGPNPAGSEFGATLATGFELLLLVTFPVLLAAAIASVVVRFRRSHGVERQQIKWLVVPFCLTPVVLVSTMFPATELFGRLFGGFVLTAIFASIGLAVLRYRLYEIDRIISRTLSYGLLTALLVGVYVAGVVGLGGVVRSATGGGGDLVVAASTLAVAALFGPARRRLQAVVDRRFNRARYDAQQTVELFAQRLRDEVDLELLAEDLRGVAGTTVRPRYVGFWMRDPELTP